MGNYYGRYDRTLDDRGRLQLPAKLFPNGLPDVFYALRGFEGCIAIYEEKDFLALQKDLSEHSYFSPEARAFIRLTLSSVREMEVDDHGRITIQKELQERYGLSNKVVVLGIEDHFEVWDKGRFESYEEDQGASFEALAAKLEEGNDGKAL